MSDNVVRMVVDDARVKWAYTRAPEVVERRVGAALDEGADRIAVAARKLAPGLFGTLRDSIIAVREEGLSRAVLAGVRYARMAEEGTGPAAGRARYYPNPDRLLEVLRASPAARGYKWARAGSAERGGQDVELWLRSRAWAMAIYAKGTKPHPFMRPAREQNRSVVVELVRAAALDGVREVFGGEV